MIRNGKFSANFSLAELATQLDGFEVLFGGVIEVGNQDGSTVGVFDSGKSGDGILILRPGQGAALAGETKVCSGTVMITGQQQVVSVFRK